MSHFCLALLSEKISEKFYRQNWHFRYKVVTSSCFQGSNVSLFQFYFFFQDQKTKPIVAAFNSFPNKYVWYYSSAQ